MTYINIANILRMLSDSFIKDSSIIEFPVTKQEIDLKNYLQGIIKTFHESSSVYCETNEDLEVDDELDFTFIDEENQNNAEHIEANKENSDSQQTILTPESPLKEKEFITLAYKKNAVSFWRAGKKKKSLSTVKNQFRMVKTERDLYRWEKQIVGGGSRIDKLKNINKATFDKFLNAKRNKLTVHDMDLRRWALKINEEIKCFNFKASSNWASKFKHANRIVSRKITKFISINHENNRNNINQSAADFLELVNPIFEEVGPDFIFNSDQSGFNKELHSGRTLDMKGVKKVESVVQSITSTTHSYTIQPTISASGKLLSPLFVVLQEPKGSFGPRVKDSLFQCKNIFVTCSKSGKMTKELMKTWFRDVYFPSTAEKSVLFVDSWSSFKDTDAINGCIPENVDFKLHMIPENTTSLVQPLDVYGFRIWKTFARRISDRLLLDNIEISLFQRNNIIKLQSLIHNQFSSPRFVEVFKYGWFKSGYKVDHPSTFRTPTEFCFNLNPMKCSFCDESNFLICSWCNEPLCFDDFFVKFHFCETFKS